LLYSATAHSATLVIESAPFTVDGIFIDDVLRSIIGWVMLCNQSVYGAGWTERPRTTSRRTSRTSFRRWQSMGTTLNYIWTRRETDWWRTSAAWLTS